jgi:hypothetical protein
MKENFEQSLQYVLVHEGGFADHPSDPGGATMKGVTLATFRRHFGANKSVNDLKNITQAQLEQIYRSGYWDKCRCDQLPSGVDYAVFDGAVNSGPGRSAIWLQGAVGAVRDGGIGPNTLSKVATEASNSRCVRAGSPERGASVCGNRTGEHRLRHETTLLFWLAVWLPSRRSSSTFVHGRRLGGVRRQGQQWRLDNGAIERVPIGNQAEIEARTQFAPQARLALRRR